MIATATTASKNPIRVLGGRGKLLRSAPLELVEELSEFMAVLEGRPAKVYVRSASVPVGNG
jgi:hypothetical protein